jgi:hypothetical protein
VSEYASSTARTAFVGHPEPLDRPELAEDLEHGVGTSLERPRRRKDMPGDEEPTGLLSGDLHAKGRYRGRITVSPLCPGSVLGVPALDLASRSRVCAGG